MSPEATANEHTNPGLEAVIQHATPRNHPWTICLLAGKGIDRPVWGSPTRPEGDFNRSRSLAEQGRYSGPSAGGRRPCNIYTTTPVELELCRQIAGLRQAHVRQRRPLRPDSG